ncbi:MAG: (d)CMP kinase [Mariprofundaceae bacterium]
MAVKLGEIRTVKGLQVALDGLSGSGKGTAATGLAAAINLPVFDSGLLYRFVAYIAVEQGVELDNESALIEMMDQTINRVTWHSSGLYVQGENWSARLRSEEVGAQASRVAKLPEVRKKLLQLQRSIASDGCVMDGRDIGTVVLPEAQAKFFLTAALRERARRRWLELRAISPEVSLDDVVTNLKKRDQQDEQRRHAPLQIAADAVYIDTTTLRSDEVVDRMLTILRRRKFILE